MSARERPEYAGSAPEELVELAGSIHRLIEQMLVTDEGHPDLREDLIWARDLADQIRERLSKHGRPSRVLRMGREGEPEDARPYYVQGPLIGGHHPLTPPLEIEHSEGITRGRVRFGVVFEGPPGCVHGGYVALFFDAILGHHNIACGIPAMTGTLTVRYRRPTPLFTELDFEVRTEKARGRKVVSAGWLRSGDRAVAEAEGLFILPEPGFQRVFEDLQESARSDEEEG